MRRDVPVIPCLVCGVDTLNGICPTHARARQAARRHPGYDDPAYRRARARARGKACVRLCGRRGAILHHVDGNPANNAPSNHEWLCKPCAKVADEQMRVRRDGPRPRGKPSPWK